MRLALGIVVVALAAVPARADEVTAESRARQHFARGREFHNDQRYREAIHEYQAAYAMVPLPELLFNLGQCHRLLGDRTEAILFYRRFVDAVPYGGVADDAREHILALEGRSPATATPLPPPPPRPFPWRGVSLGVTGAGLFLLGTGVGLAFTSSVEKKGPMTTEVGPGATPYVIGGLGVLTIATGVTLYLVKGRRPGPAWAAVPLLSPHHVGLAVTRSF